MRRFHLPGCLLFLLLCAGTPALAAPPTRDVPIDTRTGTWMSVDVHPGGQRLVFDLLGDIYELRFAGLGASETARPLTSGVAWDMQSPAQPSS